jgi:soluble lytic murein transglycosylase-like protein
MFNDATREERIAARQAPTFQERMQAAQKVGDLEAFLAAQRGEAEQRHQAARVAYEQSPEGELAALASEIRVAAALMTPEQWAKEHEGEPVVPRQPTRWDLNPEEGARFATIRLNQMAAAKGTPR